VLQILIEHTRGRRIAATLGKADHSQHANRAVEPDGEHVAGLHGMSRRGLAHAIDADMPPLDKLGGTGAGFDDPRVPQKLVEALPIQAFSF
jgi:hypothetical protein